MLSCFVEISIINANRVDPDQTPRSVASDLGLHCFLMSLFMGRRHELVNLTKNDLNVRKQKTFLKKLFKLKKKGLWRSWASAFEIFNEAKNVLTLEKMYHKKLHDLFF